MIIISEDNVSEDNLFGECEPSDNVSEDLHEKYSNDNNFIQQN